MRDLIVNVNGALVQSIMASRVAYGMSDQGMGPPALARVHPRTQTPVRATLLMTALILVLALWFPLETLARITNTIMLLNFAIVNASLVVIKRRSPLKPTEGPCHPIWVPSVGCATCLIFLGLQIWASMSG